MQVTRYEVVGLETITVPAGQFEALKVSYEMEPIRTTFFDKKGRAKKPMGDPVESVTRGFDWYAPQVGLVRHTHESVTRFKGKVDSQSESAEELVSFQP